ncbi:MAG: type II toxin-antitoxin system VapB family antitoxin [Bryobacteraceae bacterium]
MPTSLALDDALLEEALRIGGYPTKKATVNAALKEFVERRKQREVVKLFGSIDYDARYDYKQARQTTISSWD